MTPSAHLFELIKSLTKQEKIFFKTNCSVKYGSEKAYMALYNAIDRQEKYDEEKIKSSLSAWRNSRSDGAVDAHSFPFIKNYLFHLILDTLRSYYPDTLPDFTVQQMIEKAKILNAKQLKEQAWKLIQKAIQSAIKNELFPEAIQSLGIERKIIEFHQNH